MDHAGLVGLCKDLVSYWPCGFEKVVNFSNI